MDDEITPEQLAVCQRRGVTRYAAAADLKVGIAPNVKQGLEPLNGLRHIPEGDTTGWRFVVAPGYEDVWHDDELF